MGDTTQGSLEHQVVEPFPKVFKVVAVLLLVYLSLIFFASGAHVVVSGGPA